MSYLKASLIICNNESKIIKEVKDSGNHYYCGQGEKKIKILVRPASILELVELLEKELHLKFLTPFEEGIIQNLASKYLVKKKNCNYAYGMGQFKGKYYYHWIYKELSI